MKASILVIALLTALTARADTVYDNSAFAKGAIGPFGRFGGTTTYGEIFLAPTTDTVLSSFSLFLNGGVDTGQLQGYIVSWNGSRVDAVLYSSTLVDVTGAPQEFDFNTGGLSLAAGDAYAAILSIDGPEYYTFSGSTTMPGVWNNSTVPGGSFIYLNDSTYPAQFTTLPWTNYGSNFEAEFVASFVPDPPPSDPPGIAPEPGSLLLLGSGLAVLLARYRFATGRL